MSDKMKRTALTVLSVIFAVLLTYDWIKNGTFVIGRGDWLPSFLICAGAIAVVFGWMKYFEHREK